METVLEARQISKSFNGLNVLENLSFSLPAGSITSLFGENGSGKTTLFHVISGFIRPTAGVVYFKGQPITGLTPVEVARLGFGRVWQTPRICRNLFAVDNVLLAAKEHPGERVLNYFVRHKAIILAEQRLRRKAAKILEQVGLTGKLQKTAGALSFGEQKLLSIGMLLMNDAELLVLDEPFAGVNARMVDHISDVLGDLRSRGKTIYLIEHNRVKAEKISDAVHLLAKGQITKPEFGEYE